MDPERIGKAYEVFRKNYSPRKTEIIRKLKEEEYQDGFLRDLFVDVLGYTLKPDDDFNLVREFRNQSDGKKADGAILKDGRAKAVIELKSPGTKDLKSIADQAFGYKNNQPGCRYVITSNFRKLRFYIDYANEYQEFDLFRLDKEGFDLLFLILSKESIFADTPEKLKKDSAAHEENVSRQLYADYSVFRNRLFEDLVRNNPKTDKLTLFAKSRKLIDRFLFILFAEDKGLLPPNSINRIIRRFDMLRDEDAYNHCPNVIPVHADAVNWIAHCLPAAAVDEYFFWYPNPYPKAAQRNKRYHAMPFMAYLLTTLRPGGRLTFATNARFYHEEARHYMEQVWGLTCQVDRPVPAHTPPRTHFEAKYLERGEPCWELVFRAA